MREILDAQGAGCGEPAIQAARALLGQYFEQDECDREAAAAIAEPCYRVFTSIR
ncbi:hypothetical protein [Nocardia neocaledoniensis]|uniref:hypothetical protein n=1 Tax=Nocardia neocaledoniensis TaxID=236511 RepID=UPI002454C83A|nr:hypothetical protein [Nocardia neocaledoniensis]